MKKAVIFDFDDTLVESRAVKWAHHKYVAKKFYNLELNDETIREHWGKPVKALISELYQYSDTSENMHEALKSTGSDFRKTPYPGSVELIDSLFQQGIKIGILSAGSRETMLVDLQEFGFNLEHFYFIQDSTDTTKHKPDPEVFSLAFEKLSKEGIEKNDIIYVGDSLIDMRAANGAGIHFLAMTSGLYSADDFKKEGAKNIAENINEAYKFLMNKFQ